MNVLATGSKQRATASTDMNLHSSRSHAIFILYVEKRVREADSKGNSTGFKCYISRVNLVDLAGSEDVNRSNVVGARLKEAVSINSGLLQLHRVLDALGKGEAHVPYRDSALTRVLQDSLGGTSRTVFLAHVSPLARDAGETASTLRYASAARSIRNATRANVVQRPDSDAAGAGDYDDPRAGWRRRTVWLETRTFGRVFARAAGDPERPLILLVHGSGPENSSIWWNELVCQLLEARPGAFCYVQVDCPGYGRSPGDRQAIRSYPGDLLSQVVECTGHPHAHCLVGSSQGCASAFSAAVERPGVCRFLAAMDPVTHDPRRFAALAQPAMLAYDVDDAGHPASVGRAVARILPVGYCFEFAGSREPCWIGRHFAARLLAMFDRHADVAGAAGAGDTARVVPCGRVLSWLTPAGREWRRNAHWPAPPDDPDEAPDAALWRVQAACESAAGAGRPGDLFAGGAGAGEAEEGEGEEDRALRLAEEAQQGSCHACLMPLPGMGGEEGDGGAAGPAGGDGVAAAPAAAPAGAPVGRVRLSACRHLLCAPCATWTLGINPGHCPVPRCARPRVVGADAEPADGRPGAPAQSAVPRPVPEHAGEAFVMLEFGNTARAVGGDAVGRFEVTAGLAVLGPLCRNLPAAAGQLIHSVGFNINPQFPRSAVRVAAPGPFALSRTMASAFPCDLQIAWRPALGWRRLVVTYAVQHEEPDFRRRLLVRVARAGGPAAGPGRAARGEGAEVVFRWRDRDPSLPASSFVCL